ncbi:hypothetical protein ABIE32_002192 [Comamonas sp. 4034]
MAYRPPLIKGPVYITIAASVRSPDIRALAISAGWIGYEQLYCTVNAGVDVATLTVANIPDYLLTIINRGRIGGVINSGTGIYTRTRIAIDNSAGTIFGGGGKGGDGGDGSVWLTYDPNTYYANGTGGIGGPGQGFSTSGPVTVVSNNAKYPGTTGSTERSGSGTGVAYGGASGLPGLFGQAGANGDPGSFTGTGGYNGSWTPGKAGGVAGAYVDGSSYVTWIANGTRLGSAIN